MVITAVLYCCLLQPDFGVVRYEPRLETSLASSICIEFSLPIDVTTVTSKSIRVFGRWSGPCDLTYRVLGNLIVCTPTTLFSHGEQVFVSLSNGIRSTSGLALAGSGFQWQFRTASIASVGDYEFNQSLTTNRSGESSRPYGGIATDLNGDGWLDITMVNEDTADVRVFMNRADGSGLVHPFIEPTNPVNDRASPSEPADFNGDGVTDMCVSNANADTISILLGRGDGSFLPQQLLSVGDFPLGIAVLDLEGDGDDDVVTLNQGQGSFNFLINDGLGHFSVSNAVPSGIADARCLVAADMDLDGMTDLVVGAIDSQLIAIYRANGDGTFRQSQTIASGGRVWMLVSGDLNNDGFMDIATANADSNNASILLNDGNGGLLTARVYQTDLFPLASDLGDMDGDGDLDWVISCFGDFEVNSGTWIQFENMGDGRFQRKQTYDAPAAASCSLLSDLDRDGDLDLALVDEIADQLITMLNSGHSLLGDQNADDQLTAVDFAFMLTEWGACDGAICAADLDGNKTIDELDIRIFQNFWSLIP